MWMVEAIQPIQRALLALGERHPDRLVLGPDLLEGDVRRERAGARGVVELEHHGISEMRPARGSNPIKAASRPRTSSGSVVKTSKTRATRSIMRTWSTMTAPSTLRPDGMGTWNVHSLGLRVIGATSARRARW